MLYWEQSSSFKERSPMQTDEYLALGVQQGRTDDLVALVERHYDPLVGYLYRLNGGDRELAEDLVQDTFFQVLRSIRQYQYPRPFKAWLYAIATNLARNHYKRAEIRRSFPVDGQVLAGLAGETDVQSIEDADEARRAAAMLTALPSHQREVIVLRYYQELALGEISAVLHIPVGTVKSRLSLGLRRLRTLLEQRDDPSK
jgi:RNA polymerase sigma-70 factor (ECF subfamily)